MTLHKRPDEVVLGDLDDGPPVSAYDAHAIVASRSTTYLAASISIIATSATGLFLSAGLMHRAMYAASLLSTVLALLWGLRLLDAVIRDQHEAAKAWPQYIHSAWRLQRLALFCATGTTVLLGIDGRLPTL